VFVFAFSVHPGLLHPHFLAPSELILRARGASGLLHFGHALVTLDTALLVVVALHFMKLLDHTAVAWAGFLGGALAVLGSLTLAADKGALCLTEEQSPFKLAEPSFFCRSSPDWNSRWS